MVVVCGESAVSKAGNENGPVDLWGYSTFVITARLLVTERDGHLVGRFNTAERVVSFVTRPFIFVVVDLKSTASRIRCYILIKLAKRPRTSSSLARLSNNAGHSKHAFAFTSLTSVCLFTADRYQKRLLVANRS